MKTTPKTINIILDETEHQDALKKKGKRTWKQVLEDGLKKQANRN